MSDLTIDEAVSLHMSAFLKIATEVAVKIGDETTLTLESIEETWDKMRYHAREAFAAKHVRLEVEWTLNFEENRNQLETNKV